MLAQQAVFELQLNEVCVEVDNRAKALHPLCDEHRERLRDPGELSSQYVFLALTVCFHGATTRAEPSR